MPRHPRFLAGVTSPESITAEAPESVSVESDFVVILAALLCALICVVGLVAVARCAWLRRGTISARSPAQALANKGLKKKALQSLPKLIYSSAGAGSGKSNEECAICLTEFVSGDEIRMLPQCGHRFHIGCVDTWLGSHSSCPSCRHILVIGRCQKCGEFPALSSAGTGSSTRVETEMESERKAREDNYADGSLT